MSIAEHLTIMPVVSADGQRWGPVVIMPGVVQKVRVRPDGNKALLVDYFPKYVQVLNLTPVRMTKEIFIKWVKKFIKEKYIRRKERNYLLFSMDAFGTTFRTVRHCCCKTTTAPRIRFQHTLRKGRRYLTIVRLLRSKNICTHKRACVFRVCTQ